MKFPTLAGFSAGLLVAGMFGFALSDIGHSSAGKSDGSAQLRPIADSGASRAKQVYNATKDSVAYISADTSQGTATGSGFVVSKDGKIITNAHVVDGAQQVTVKLGTKGQAQAAQVLAADTSKDLALLKIDASTTPLPLGDSSSVQVGDTTYAIGNPYGLDHTFTSGIVSAIGRQIQSPDGTPIDGAIQTDAAINPGNSGGALLDADGRVIGVNSQIASASQDGSPSGNVGIGFAIPSNTVKDFVAHPTSTQQAEPQADPYSQQQADPYGDQQQADPYGDQQVDPYGDQQQADPYSGVDPYALLP